MDPTGRLHSTFREPQTEMYTKFVNYLPKTQEQRNPKQCQRNQVTKYDGWTAIFRIFKPFRHAISSIGGRCFALVQNICYFCVSDHIHHFGKSTWDTFLWSEFNLLARLWLKEEMQVEASCLAELVITKAVLLLIYIFIALSINLGNAKCSGY